MPKMSLTPGVAPVWAKAGVMNIRLSSRIERQGRLPHQPRGI
jgi:hypothetical protein